MSHSYTYWSDISKARSLSLEGDGENILIFLFTFIPLSYNIHILTMLIQVGSLTCSAKVSFIIFIVIRCNIRSILLTHRTTFSMILKRAGRVDRSHRHIFEPYSRAIYRA